MNWFEKVKLTLAVAKTVYTGKGAKTLEKVDRASDAAAHILEGLRIAKDAVKK